MARFAWKMRRERMDIKRAGTPGKERLRVKGQNDPKLQLYKIGSKYFCFFKIRC